jgi:hypothetical protein
MLLSVRQLTLLHIIMEVIILLLYHLLVFNIVLALLTIYSVLAGRWRRQRDGLRGSIPAACRRRASFAAGSFTHGVPGRQDVPRRRRRHAGDGRLRSANVNARHGKCSSPTRPISAQYFGLSWPFLLTVSLEKAKLVSGSYRYT